jgi:DNA-binding transcriptional regulator YhcF (GntR family)
MQDTSGEEHREPGLSLQVVREIAAEIGVEAHLVDRAAASLSRSSPSRVAALVGGPIKERLVDTHAHKLSESEIRELVDRIRGVMHRRGQVTDAIGSVQWQAEGLETVALTISPEEEGTRIQILADRSVALGLSLGPPTFLGLLIAGIIADGLQPGIGASIAMVGTGGLVGLGIGRTIWGITARSFRRRLDALHSEVVRFMGGREEEEHLASAPSDLEREADGSPS